MSQAELEKQRGDGGQDSLSLHNEKLEDLLRENDFESMSAESILTWVSSAFSPGRATFRRTGGRNDVEPCRNCHDFLVGHQLP